MSRCRRSEWFNALDEPDQATVAEVAKAAAFMSAFSICNILDGTRASDSHGGTLRLLYIAPDGTETLLNDPIRCELHSELRGAALRPERTEQQRIRFTN